MDDTSQIHIDGTLTREDIKRHIAHEFVVPEGTTRLKIRFHYSPVYVDDQQVKNMLCLSLFDPEGLRGAGHRLGDTHTVDVSAAEATPGYEPRPVQPGTWTVVIDSHMILPGQPITYTFDITLSSERVTTNARPWPKPERHSRGPGWYRGDLHTHSRHSDAAWDIPDLLDYARTQNLDFITLTDHNTVSGLKQMDSLNSDGIATLGGFELTTFYGHALALGVREWFDWRVRPGVTMSDIAAAITNAGGFFVIAHPMSVGDPTCTGCNWLYDDLMPGAARAVEIWNASWESRANNESAVQLWYKWLNEGHRLVATAGTDNHGNPAPEARLGFNVVYADDLCEQAILEAIRDGHLYVSSGPTLEITGEASTEATAIAGDTLHHDAAQITARWDHCDAGDVLRFIVDGQVREEFLAGVDGERAWPLTIEQGAWCTVEIREPNGYLRAVSNPIFLR